MERKKLLCTMCCIGLLLAFCFNSIQNIVFATSNVTCQFNGGVLNSNGGVDYTINNQTISIELATKSGDTYTKVNITNLQQSIDLDSASYYLKISDASNVDLMCNGSRLSIPSDGYFLLTSSIFNNGIAIFELETKLLEPGTFTLTAHFQGVDTPVQMDDMGSIVIPDDWTSGTVEFYLNSEQLEIEGISNISEINNSISGTREQLVISEDFMNYGKALLHLVGSNNAMAITQLVTKDLINAIVMAPISMSYNFGSADVSQAIITKADKTQNVSIFFGNTEANLVVTGCNVDKITNATLPNGGTATINNDGSVTLKLLPLNQETDTLVKLTILLKNGTTITRNVNVKRTAVTLSVDSRVNKVTAGYVMNKGYLYNNKSHDESNFDAYLQVILYKDNMVVGFKQIQIDDKELVDGLEENESFAKETFDEDPIVIFNNEIAGVDKVSVFLTNGPISASSNTLPSIEYGVGAGVTVEWEEK